MEEEHGKKKNKILNKAEGNGKEKKHNTKLDAEHGKVKNAILNRT